MKTLKFLLVGAVALMAFAGCSDDVEEPVVPNKEDNQNQGNNQEQEQEYDETYYAEHASISCSDPKFTVTDDGVTVSFKVSGGEITIAVDCGTEWTAQNSAEDIFGCSIQSTSVTITAEQNLVEAELMGIIKLVTMPSQIEFATINVTQDAYGSPEITVDANEWHTPAVGDGLTTTIGVEATGGWSVENNADWLTVKKTETGLNLAVVENNETTERVAEVVLTCADEFNSDAETIKVTQDGLAYITLSEENLFLSSFGSSISVAVESNFDWECVCDAVWLTVTKNEAKKSLTIDYANNGTGNERETIVTIAAGDGAVNIAETELKITQSWENTDALILEYTIPYKNSRVQLPIYDCSNVTIDWGDGSTEVTSSNNPAHTYSTAGTYTVTINGEIKQLYGEQRERGNSVAIVGASYLTSVKQWGNLNPTRMYWAFYGCNSLESLPEGSGPFSNVTSFESAFYDCSSLKELPEGIFANCSAVTTFRSTFRNCSSLTSAPSFEGCSSAKTFVETFYGCTALTTIPENIFSGCVSATTFEYAFCGCTALTTVPENMFSGCTAVTSFFHTFHNCSSLGFVPSFEGCSSATSFQSTFYGCTSLTTVPENMFSGCVAVTTFEDTFRKCSSLTSAPSFKGCSAVTTFSCTFCDCSSLKTVPENMFSGCSAVTTFYGVLCRCTDLTALPGNIFSGCSAVTSFSYAFEDCPLATVPVSLFDDTLLVTNFGSTFYGCSSISGESPYTELDVEGEKVNVHLYQRSNYPEYMGCSTPTSYSDCFTGSSFSDIDSIPSSWGGNGN